MKPVAQPTINLGEAGFPVVRKCFHHNVYSIPCEPVTVYLTLMVISRRDKPQLAATVYIL